MTDRDLDQSGHGFQRVRTYLGPSLGWVDELVEPTTFISVSGTYEIKPGDSSILVDCPGGVTIQLPDVTVWVQQKAYQPATAFSRSITVKDVGGNAGNFPIIVRPFGTQAVDGNAQDVALAQPGIGIRFFPSIDAPAPVSPGWIADIAPGILSGAGGGDVIANGNNLFTGTNTFSGVTAFNNVATAVTMPPADNTTKIATTAFVHGAISVDVPAYLAANTYVQHAGTGPGTLFDKLAGYTDVPYQIQVVSLPAAGLKRAGPNLLLADDLLALENLSGTNNIYYRSGVSAWSAVTMGANMTFSGGVLNSTAGGAPSTAEYITSSSDPSLTAERVLTDTASVTWDFSTPGQAKANSIVSGGNVSNSGTPTATQYARWVDATHIEGRSATQVRTDIAAQPLDTTLTNIAALTTANDQIIYATGSDTFAMTGFTGFARTLLDDADAATARNTLGAAPLDSPAFINNPTAPTQVLTDNSTKLATTAFVKGQGYQTAGDVTAAITAQAQPLDADLTSIAGYSATGSWLYRSAANTWSPVTIGTGLSFAGGTLTATGSGGNVSNSGTPNTDDLAYWVTSTTIKGVSLATHRTNATFTGTTNTASIISSGTITATGAITSNNAVKAQTAAGDYAVQLSAITTQSRITATGSAIDVPIYYTTKGTGAHFWYTNAFGNAQFAVVHQTIAGYIQFSGGDAGAGAVNLQMQGGAAGNRIAILNANLAGKTQITGIVDGSAVPASMIGETLSPSTFSSVSVTAASTSNVASISLPAGIWDVWVQGHVSSTGITIATQGLGTISGVVPSGTGNSWTTSLNGSSNMGTASCATRASFNVSATTTVYFVGNAGAVATTYTGAIFARRVA